jgi:Flp pilus assembly protein TadG
MIGQRRINGRDHDACRRPPRVARRPNDRGDAGLPLLLITPALLFIVLHLVNASQQLYERREAYSVAAAAARFGNQGDPLAIRERSTAAIDTAASESSIRNFVADQGYVVTNLTFSDDRGDGTFTISVEVEKAVDYIFPMPSALSDTVSGRAESVLNRGVSAPGQP